MVAYNLITKSANVDDAPVKKHSFMVHIYQFYNCDTSLEKSMSYNHENNFVQSLNAVVSVITYLCEH